MLPAEAGAVPDVEIVYTDVPATLPDALARGVRFQAGRDKLLLVVDGVARFLIEQGNKISIARCPSAEDDDVRAFLLGSVFGALLHQRQDLVLHGSAIEWNGEAVVFVGLSGVGKSTLASAFRKKGHAILTDDLSVIRPGPSGRMLVSPGFPQIKLWLDSLKRLDLSPDGLRRIRNKLEKRAIPLGEDFAGGALPVRKLYMLRPHNRPDLKLVALDGPQKFHVLKNHTYRFGFLAAIEGKMGHFQYGLKLAQQARMAVVIRPREPFLLDELVALIESDLKNDVGEAQDAG
ncbi:MAG TPA: hypothetical protein VHA37_09915 [Candidatus Saccharimonadales bacterium]|nr:hypothetical protein [Candidatus Saccharimonadales bacterium]